MKKVLLLVCINLFAYDIFTASKMGNYYQLVSNSVSKCSIKINPIATFGSLDNLSHLINKNTGLGAIVQDDVFKFFLKTADRKSLYKIQYNKILPHYIEVIYIIGRNKSTFNKENLKNATIAIGRFGSGSAISGFLLMGKLGVQSKLLYIDKNTAIDLLLNQDVDFLIYVAKYDSKNNKYAFWVDKVLRKYPKHLYLISAPSIEEYQKITTKNNIVLLSVKTHFISTIEDNKTNQKIFQCLK